MKLLSILFLSLFAAPSIAQKLVFRDISEVANVRRGKVCTPKVSLNQSQSQLFGHPDLGYALLRYKGKGVTKKTRLIIHKVSDDLNIDPQGIEYPCPKGLVIRCIEKIICLPEEGLFRFIFNGFQNGKGMLFMQDYKPADGQFESKMKVVMTFEHDQGTRNVAHNEVQIKTSPDGKLYMAVTVNPVKESALKKVIKVSVFDKEGNHRNSAVVEAKKLFKIHDFHLSDQGEFLILSTWLEKQSSSNHQLTFQKFDLDGQASDSFDLHIAGCSLKSGNLISDDEGKALICIGHYVQGTFQTPGISGCFFAKIDLLNNEVAVIKAHEFPFMNKKEQKKMKKHSFSIESQRKTVTTSNGYSLATRHLQFFSRKGALPALDIAGVNSSLAIGCDLASMEVNVSGHSICSFDKAGELLDVHPILDKRRVLDVNKETSLWLGISSYPYKDMTISFVEQRIGNNQPENHVMLYTSPTGQNASYHFNKHLVNAQMLAAQTIEVTAGHYLTLFKGGHDHLITEIKLK